MPIADKKIDLDLPVEAYDAEGNLKEKPVNVSDEASTEGSQPEEKKEESVDKEDEQRVPYSRFAKIREERDKAEREAEEARDLVRSLSQRREPEATYAPSSYDEDYAREVRRLYGDTPVADEIIAIQTRQMRAIEERAERRAIEAVERVRERETEVLSQNESIIDKRLESLESRLGRTLNENEQDALLEIVDEYTPTGEDGKYLGEILPFDKAWEVYELRQEKKSLTSRQSRNPALAASSARSSGEPSSSGSNSTQPMSSNNWKSFYDRIAKL